MKNTCGVSPKNSKPYYWVYHFPVTIGVALTSCTDVLLSSNMTLRKKIILQNQCWIFREYRFSKVHQRCWSKHHCCHATLSRSDMKIWCQNPTILQVQPLCLGWHDSLVSKLVEVTGSSTTVAALTNLFQWDLHVLGQLTTFFNHLPNLWKCKTPPTCTKVC